MLKVFANVTWKEKKKPTTFTLIPNIHYSHSANKSVFMVVL